MTVLSSASAPANSRRSRDIYALDYFKRPNYLKVYQCLMEGMTDGGYTFSDPWDWQVKKHKAQEKARADAAAAKAALVEAKGRVPIK
ncbi:hypothetical protein PENTCL1PPCAC_12214, partial [Pristionchus entomophagus]